MTAAAIEFDGVSKTYPGGTRAVESLDLHIDEGELMVFVGPSGCGKTTALRMVAGLEDVTSGTIRLDGKPVNDVSSRDRDVAMVFQNYALYPHMSVAQNIAFSLSMRGVPRQEQDTKVREAANVLGLSEVLARKPRALSGGQRQRVAMGRALVREPAVFLMDEPLSNLDAQLRVQMRTEVLRVQRRLGVATLYVTHDQTEAMTMGDRVAVMRAGVLQQLASPQELYDRPANLFVAAFIGSPSMNLYEATLGRSDGLTTVTLGSQQLRLPADVGARLTGIGDGARTIVVGIRPENLTVGTGVADGGRLVAEVELVEALGNEQLVHFVIDATKLRTGVEAAPAAGTISDVGGATGIARVDPRVSIAAGERATFEVDLEHLHLFDPQTGTAL
jgi:multiple sugar transport system ATP-binding protein